MKAVTNDISFREDTRSGLLRLDKVVCSALGGLIRALPRTFDDSGMGIKLLFCPGLVLPAVQ